MPCRSGIAQRSRAFELRFPERSRIKLPRLNSRDFQGNDRFEVEDRLGSGGFGVVYRAYDRVTRSTVALKTLPDATASSLLRFKNEFRSLAGIVHPNLVSLYELIAEKGDWFFTMELIDGVDFLQHVYGTDVEVGDESPTETIVRMAGAGTEAILSGSVTVQRPRFNAALGERLRDALGQLGNGLSYLHSRGRLHRDLKPANVLVTKEGRVVLLDFGMVTQLETADEMLQPLMGTPAYMAPELCEMSSSEESDWYSVGTMLYEAITGRLPFNGDGLALLMQKAAADAPDPAEIVDDVPLDLRALTMSLLQRNPANRGSGADIRRVATSRPSLPIAIMRPAKRSITGREREMEKLERAFDIVRQGRATVVTLRGRSGMGKSLLIQTFLDDIRARFTRAVVLFARCYERESLPYKALDGIVDELVQVLLRLPQTERDEVLRDDGKDLARIFPVLASTLRDNDVVQEAEEPEDPQEIRQRAFTQLRHILRRLATMRPVILAIDDLQWGDVDSALVFADLFRSGNPPPLMLLGAYRTEDADVAPFLKTFRRAVEISAAAKLSLSQQSGRFRQIIGGETINLTIDELSVEASKKIAVELLYGGVANAEELAEQIAHESGGNPFFISELARFALTASTRPTPSELRLEHVIASRLARLSEDARRILTTLSVAAKPLSHDVCRTSAGVENPYLSAVATLRAACMVKMHGTGEDDEIEVYHDRIRELVLAQIEPGSLKAIHNNLAVTLEAADDPNYETIAQHYRAAGELGRAVDLTLRAADEAFESLAFDSAARLYRAAIEIMSEKAPSGVYARLGESLVNASRGTEAARAYLTAAKMAEGEEATELRRRAAEQLLRSGHVEEGLAVLRSVLDAIGMRLPKTTRTALMKLIIRRFRLFLRGLRYEVHSERSIPKRTLTRIDTSWSAAIGLGLVDPIRGAEFQTQHLFLALEAGEPYRLARALAVEAAYSASFGSATVSRTNRLLRRAESLANRTSNIHAAALVRLFRGIAAVFRGEWLEGQELCDQSEQMLRTRCRGVGWELFNARMYSLLALMWRGEIAELQSRLPMLLQDVTSVGDLYGETYVRTRVSWYMHLLDDRPELAAAEDRQAIGKWAQTGFHTHHYHHLLAQSEIALYERDPLLASTLLNDNWARLRASMLLQAQIVAIEALYLRGRVAIAAMKMNGATRDMRRIADRSMAGIRKERAAWGDALALLLNGSMHLVDGRTENGIRLLWNAEQALTGCGMRLHAAAVRARIGGVTGEPGAALRDAAEHWMIAQHIRNPQAVTDLLVP